MKNYNLKLKIIFLIILCFGIFGLPSETLVKLGLAKNSLAATITPVNCSSATTVNTALTNASSGDTIQCIAINGGWSSGTVTIPSTKNLTLDGNTVTVGGSIAMPSSASYQVRITNFTFTLGEDVFTFSGGLLTNKPWRIDHCNFTGSTAALLRTRVGPGLIDNCTFTTTNPFHQIVEHWGWGSDVYTGWLDDIVPGSPNAIYFEDNTFTGPSTTWPGYSAEQAYYGSRFVSRYNTLSGAIWEIHSSPSPGARWFEIYRNTYTNHSAICIRGASGIILDESGYDWLPILKDGTSGIPDYWPWRPGRGKITSGPPYNDGSITELFPIYVVNSSPAPIINGGGYCAAATAGALALNTDVYLPSSGTYASLPGSCTQNQGYWVTDRGGNWDTTHGGNNDGMLYKCDAGGAWQPYYIPYTYPHPLRNENTCTYTYSEWSTCQPDGTQTRTKLSESPAGCSGTPVTSQSCVYVFPTDQYIQAESGILSGMQQFTLGLDTYIYTTTKDQGSAKFTFNITQAGQYMMQAKVNSNNDSGQNSFYVGLDSEAAQNNNYYAYSTPVINGYVWDDVNRTGNGTTLPEFNPMIWNLTAGLHTFTFYGREANTWLDQIILKRVTADTTPPAAPSGVTVS